VKVHRSNMIRKVKIASVADLCRMADKLKQLPEHSGDVS
jgi:FixJ family two-component response regulator